MKKEIDSISKALIDSVKSDTTLKTNAAEYYADKTEELVYKKIERYANKAKKILNNLRAIEIVLNKEIRTSHITDEKQKQYITKEMRAAYALIMNFRSTILDEKIKYLIQLDSKTQSEIAILSTRQILNSTRLATKSGGGLKLDVNATEIQKIINKKNAPLFSQDIVKRVKEALEIIISVNKTLSGRTYTQEEFNNLRYKYTGDTFSKIEEGKFAYVNQGYALEAALKTVISNQDLDILMNIESRYKAYFNAIKNISTFRSGGDMNREETEELLKLDGKMKGLIGAVQLQVKRVKENTNAQLVTLESLIYELTNILLIFKGINKKDLKNVFEKYYTNGMKSTDAFGKIKKILYEKIEKDKYVQGLFKYLDDNFSLK